MKKQCLCAFFLCACLLMLGGCGGGGGEQTPPEDRAEETAIPVQTGSLVLTPEDDPYAGNPEAAQAASEALRSALEEDAPEDGVQWQEGLLSKIPPFTGDAVLLDWATADTTAALSYKDVSKRDVDGYIDLLETEGFTGSETIIGGADMTEGTYTHSERGVSVYLLYSGPTTVVEYNTFSIAIKAL